MLPSMQVAAEAASMLKRSRGRFLGDLQMDQQRLRADLEVLRGEVETFTRQGDISQVGHLSRGPCLPVSSTYCCQKTFRGQRHMLQRACPQVCKFVLWPMCDHVTAHCVGRLILLQGICCAKQASAAPPCRWRLWVAGCRPCNLTWATALDICLVAICRFTGAAHMAMSCRWTTI